jgi:hypothetical protein
MARPISISLTGVMHRGLDNRQSESKIPENYVENEPSAFFRERFSFMTSKSPLPPQDVNTKPPCKHPRVQIVSRDEDSEFVECKECGEIFESSELKDMSIEERTKESEI